MVAVLRIVKDTGLLDAYPNLKTYVERGEVRPAFRQALADQMAGFTGATPPQFIEWEKAMKEKQGELQ